MNKFEDGKSYSFPLGYLTVKRILDPDGAVPAQVEASLHLNHSKFFADKTISLTSPVLVDRSRGEYVLTPEGFCYASDLTMPDLSAEERNCRCVFQPMSEPQTVKIPKPAADPKPDLPAGAGMLLNKFDPKDPVMASMASQINVTSGGDDFPNKDQAADPASSPASGYKVSHLLAEYGLMGMMCFKIPVKHAEFIRALLDKADEVI